MAYYSLGPDPDRSFLVGFLKKAFTSKKSEKRNRHARTLSRAGS